MKGDSALQGVFSNTEGYLWLVTVAEKAPDVSILHYAGQPLGKDNPVPGATAEAEEPCAREPCCVRVSAGWTSAC